MYSNSDVNVQFEDIRLNYYWQTIKIAKLLAPLLVQLGLLS